MPNRADDVGFALINPPFNGATAAVAAAGSVGGYIRRDVTDLNVGRQESWRSSPFKDDNRDGGPMKFRNVNSRASSVRNDGHAAQQNADWYSTAMETGTSTGAVAVRSTPCRNAE